jgi:hypothetical protein
MKKTIDMKIVKLSRIMFLPVLCLWTLSSCVKDMAGYCPGGESGEPYKTTRLAIRLPEIQNGMKSRAVASDFDAIRNLNIFIADGDEIRHRLYIDVANFNTPLDETDGGITFERDANGGVVTYAGEWLEVQEGINGWGRDNYIVVANYGPAIDAATAPDLPALRRLEVEGANGEVDTNRNVMFGESGTGVTIDTSSKSGSKSVELKRMAAMITLTINGTDRLNPGVTISPVSVSLHNVPRASYVGQNNIVTDAPGGTTPRSNAVAPNGENFDIRSWGAITRGQRIGAHYPETAPGSGEYDYSVPTVRPLFMYENYHGAGFGATETEQIWKRPAVAARNRTSIEQHDDACSYLQVTARYSDGTQYGEIKYRVFLGADETRNFDVMRNHYYMVTLNLSGSGISEGDASWRLDTNLGRNIEISDSDFILNGAGEMIVIDVDDSGTPAAVKINYTSGTRDWIYVYGGGQWQNLNAIQNDNFPVTSGQLFLYAPPMIRPTTWNDAGHMRQVTFNVATANGSTATPDITVTQYEPIAIPLSRYAGYPEIVAKATELGFGISGTLYLDRVDNPEIPWGFEAVQITTDSPSGFTNGDNLMVNHGTVADDYFPQGFNGSAMMHAAFMRYYQRRGAPIGMYPAQNLTIAAIRGYTPPPGYPSRFFIPSVEEWRLLNMLHNAVPIDFEEGYTIPPFIPYWSSTADITAGSRDSYVFNMDGTIEGGASLEARTAARRYRMMYYMP